MHVVVGCAAPNPRAYEPDLPESKTFCLCICLYGKPVEIVGRFSICVDHPRHDSLVTSDGTPSASEDYVQYMGGVEDLRAAVRKNISTK